MAIRFPPLPFELAALEPYSSKETLEFHHGKHHKNYVKILNELLVGTHYETHTLAEIVKESFNVDSAIYNNAAQAWNHDFYWKCLEPRGRLPSSSFVDLIEKDFKSFKKFKEEFLEAGKNVFGSGWVWLVQSNGKLSIESLSNAGNPMVFGKKPILVCDVWEHAYYLDHKNMRENYLKNFWPLVNWVFVERNCALTFDGSKPQRHPLQENINVEL